MSGFKDITELLITFISGNATREEKDYIQVWSEQSEENKHKLAELSDLWDSSWSYGEYQLDVNARFNKLRSRIKENQKFSFKTSALLRYAAIFIFAIVLGSTGSMFYKSGKLKRQINEFNITQISSPLGSKTSLILPDGTEVWLNAGSTLRYPDNFSDLSERKLNLEGEAFFKVSVNRNKPFTVSVDGVVIRALGTSFNVKAYSGDPMIETTLVEGKISVSFKNRTVDREIVLQPNEHISIDRSNFEVSDSNSTHNELKDNESIVQSAANNEIVIRKEVNTILYTSWKDKHWIIENEKLSSLSEKLERRYSVSIFLKDANLSDIHFTGTLVDESIEQVLDVICYASPIRYEIDGNNVYLFSKKQ